jgi:two-component system response regulator AtoC
VTGANTTNDFMKVLCVDDDERVLLQMQSAIEGLKYDVQCCNGAKAKALTIEEALHFDAAVVDWQLESEIRGEEVGALLRNKNPHIFLVMLTAHGTVERTRRAMKSGFDDYLTKPLDQGELEEVLLEAKNQTGYRRSKDTLLEELEQCQKAGIALFGEHPNFLEAFRKAASVAPFDVLVLLLGQTGTGKELIARALRQLSPRAQQPFVTVHCAALAPTLLESELFGHEKGAFTGAHERRIGRIELAQGGTLFLDEIGEIDAALQVKLLRFLGERTFERVGSNETLTADVRLVAATNKNLEELVKVGTFREDLFYRLKMIKIKLPSLMDRASDVPILAHKFLEAACSQHKIETICFETSALEALRSHNWPGNVRELKSNIERAAILAGKKRKISVADLELQQPTEMTVKSPTETFKVASGLPVDGQSTGREYWARLKGNGFKLWEIVNPESVLAQAKKALENATLSDVSSPTTAGQNAGTSNPTRKAKTIWRLDEFVPPPPFRVSYVNPMSCEIEEFEIHWGSDYHPEPNYFKSLYAPKHGTYQIPLIRAAIYRYAVEHNISKFRKAFEKMTSTVIDDKLAGLVKGSGKGNFKTGAVNLWETESKGKEETSAFRPCTGILRNNAMKVDEEIKKYFPDYKRPTV